MASAGAVNRGFGASVDYIPFFFLVSWEPLQLFLEPSVFREDPEVTIENEQSQKSAHVDYKPNVTTMIVS